MTTLCQCPYETASLAGTTGSMRGVLLCAVCDLPKSSCPAGGDSVLDEAGCMAALSFGPAEVRLFRSLVTAGRIPSIPFSPRVKRFHLRTILGKYKQTLAALLLLLATSASAADFAGFVRAVHQVETSGRTGAILGDGGRALGPLQIHRGCFKDSGVAGRYEDVSSLPVARAVMHGYLSRYAPAALASGDWATCARVWNGGPKGASKTATLAYWRKVEGKL